MVAWSALLLGGSMSVAANVLHVTQVVGPGMGGASVPQAVGASFWPVALILSIEVIARVNWPDAKVYTALRWGGVGAVALVAAIVSYRHMHGLLLHWGEESITALLGPLGVDGLVTVGAVALMAISHNRTSPKPTPTRETTPKTAWKLKKREPEKPTVATPAAPTPAKRQDSPRPEPVAEPLKQPAKPAPEVREEPTPDPIAQEKPTEVPIPAPVEPAPVAPEVVEPPAPVANPVNVSVFSEAGLPAHLHDQVANRLRSIMNQGRRPEPGDLANLGVPGGMAKRLITRSINGHQAAAV